MPVPLLILSDAPTASTGLGRITRDIATRIHQHMPDVFEVGTLGYGGDYSRSLGFPQYSLDMRDWVAFNLPDVWRDLAGTRKGVMMTVWDASRMLWFTHPANCPDPRLRKFLTSQPFEKWGYFPIDATGINDKLAGNLKSVIEGYDRALAYSDWARAILRRTVQPSMDVDQVPHGIDTSVFQPRPRVQARHSFGVRIGAKYVRGKRNGQYCAIPDDAFLVGIVATNQIRKDWGLGLTTVAELARERNTWVWIKTDQEENSWSIPWLLNDLGLVENAVVTISDFTDEQMSWCYSACDVTLGIGLGEGFGFPIFESLACGTPCIHGNYGGAAEHLPPEMLVEAVASRIESPYNCYRKVYDPVDWANAIRKLGKLRTTLPKHLDWNGPTLWPRWEAWLRKGLANGSDVLCHSDTELGRVAGVLPELEGHSK